MNFNSLVLFSAFFISIFSDEVFAVKKRFNEEGRNSQFLGRKIIRNSAGDKENSRNHLPQTRAITHKLRTNFPRTTQKKDIHSFKKTRPLRNYKGLRMSKLIIPPSIETKSPPQRALGPNRKKYQQINENKAPIRKDNLEKTVGAQTYKIEKIKTPKKFLQNDGAVLANQKKNIDDHRIFAFHAELDQIKQELDDITRELNSSEFRQKIREYFNGLNEDQKDQFEKAMDFLDFKF